MINALHIKKGDTVIVLSGDDRGKSAKVVRAFPKTRKVLVEGVNVIKRHEKPRRQGQKGQTVERAMPIDASNVKLAGKSKKAKK